MFSLPPLIPKQRDSGRGWEDWNDRSHEKELNLEIEAA